MRSSLKGGLPADQTSNTASSAGAAYVFVRDGTTWSQQAYLKASNTEEYDDFGGAVAVSGDTVMIGALGEDSAATGVNGDQTSNAASGAGAVYIFVRDGNTLSQQAYLKASNTGAGDWFGFTVAVSGDMVVVGAFREDSAATGVNGDQTSNAAVDAGAAYIYVVDTMTPLPTLTPTSVPPTATATSVPPTATATAATATSTPIAPTATAIATATSTPSTHEVYLPLVIK